MPALLDDKATDGRIGDATKTSTTAEELPDLVERQVLCEKKFVNCGAVLGEHRSALLVGTRLMTDTGHQFVLFDFVMQSHNGSSRTLKKEQCKNSFPCIEAGKAATTKILVVQAAYSPQLRSDCSRVSCFRLRMALPFLSSES